MRPSFVRCLKTVGTLLLAAALVVRPQPTCAVQVTQEAESRPARLSFVEGTVSFWRTGAEDWVRARLNTPLTVGDHLYASSGSKFEVQFAAEAFVRGDEGAELSVESLDPAYVQLRVSKGVVAVDVRTLDPGLVIEVDTPGAAFTLNNPGYYRADVGETTTELVVREGGDAEAVVEAGERWLVHSGELVVVDPTSAAAVRTYRAPQPDDWDEWNKQRSASVGAANSRQYLPRDVYGGEVLDRYGSWDDAPDYGRVWYPREVQQDWAPYSLGHWVWDPFFGWTWIDDSPWGWAPFHYGRWVRVGPRWGWAPGPIVERPFYAPAVVGFMYGSHVRIGFGTGPIGWVALGWGEPIVPWWGHRGFVGRPCWRGWGGPHIVNQVVIREREVVHIDRIKYSHARTPGAMYGGPRDRFGQGGFRPARLDADQSSFRPVRGALPVRPGARSLVPFSGDDDRRVPVPGRDVLDRPTVARRQPTDPLTRLRTSGVRPARHEPGGRSVVPQRMSPRVLEADNPAPAPPRGEPVAGRARRSLEHGATSGDGVQSPRNRVERPHRPNDPQVPRDAFGESPGVERPVVPRVPDGGGSVDGRSEPRQRNGRRSERAVAPPPAPDVAPADAGADANSNGRVREPRPARPQRPERSEPQPQPAPRRSSETQVEGAGRYEPRGRQVRPEVPRGRYDAAPHPQPMPQPEAAPVPDAAEARPAERRSQPRERVQQNPLERYQERAPRSAPAAPDARGMGVPERRVEPPRSLQEMRNRYERMRPSENHEPMRVPEGAAPPPAPVRERSQHESAPHSARPGR